jgi:acetoin:2,6-dichlorophenolindophenol oxidoreductase subunit alpha
MSIDKNPLGLYKEMLRIRLFEDKVSFLFTRGLIHGTAHFCTGQEAAAVGVCSVINDDDFVTSTHRGHGHALAKGLDMRRFLAELMGKETGFCSGRGGTQHCTSMKDNFLANGITGGTAVTGTGMALGFKMKKVSRIVVSFFGDGAINEGHLHETLNMAAVWKLPIVFICENNLYAMSTHTKEVMVEQELYKRAAMYGMRTLCADGNNVEQVQSVTRDAAEYARSGLGPVFVELKTYRFSGHSKNDQFLYRTREEEQEWRKRDCISSFEMKLKVIYGVGNEDIDKVKKDVENEIEDALSFAKESPFPKEETLWDHVYA